MLDHYAVSRSEPLERLAGGLGIELFAQRDDLISFPLGGNKAIKICAEFSALDALPEVVITNGSLDSNHCRTLAFVAAKLGFHAHLVLHSDLKNPGLHPAMGMLSDLGATFDIVPASQIRIEIARSNDSYVRAGKSTYVLNGGCHTPAGARVYAERAWEVARRDEPAHIVVASGTGATHGGIAAGIYRSGIDCQVHGISVARSRERGLAPVREAASWAGLPAEAPLNFIDDFIDGGYGKSGQETMSAVRVAWSYGFPTDPTYTGKAFRGLLDLVKKKRISQGDRVIFWHTGGLANSIYSRIDAK